MSNNDFDRAVNFLQGALDNAAKQDDAFLPGFNSPAGARPAAPENAAPTSDEKPAEADSFTPPPEADAPPLPGLTTPQEEPPPVIHHKLGKASLELHPPAQKRAALAAQAAGNAKALKTNLRLSPTIALGALSAVLGLGLVVACLCLLNAPEAPAAEVSDDIPLALLPETADPTLWETVSKMSGEINGASLAFDRGLATDVNGRVFKLQLDFCRCGADIYAKVTGDKTYVVCLDDQGAIRKVYPAPKNNKPLKLIFGSCP